MRTILFTVLITACFISCDTSNNNVNPDDDPVLENFIGKGELWDAGVLYIEKHESKILRLILPSSKVQWKVTDYSHTDSETIIVLNENGIDPVENISIDTEHRITVNWNTLKGEESVQENSVDENGKIVSDRSWTTIGNIIQGNVHDLNDSPSQGTRRFWYEYEDIVYETVENKLVRYSLSDRHKLGFDEPVMQEISETKTIETKKMDMPFQIDGYDIVERFEKEINWVNGQYTLTIYREFYNNSTYVKEEIYQTRERNLLENYIHIIE